MKAILYWADIKKVNLLVLGRKAEQAGIGIVAELLARKSSTSILFIPDRAVKVRNIFVPVDFSEHSKFAMERALGIASQLQNVTVSCCHV